MLFGLLVFVFLVALFALQNAEAVAIRFFFWQFPRVSLALVILGSLLAGALLAFLFGLRRQLRLARQLRACLRENEDLRAALARTQKQASLEDTQLFAPPPTV